MVKESHLRSVLKGISWRIIAGITTVTIAYLITGELHDALKIGFWEFFVKILVYYFHERVWQFAYKDNIYSRTKSLLKTISWRVLASSATFIISLLVIDQGNVGSQATLITIFESSSKMILFYIHERLWLKIPLGTIRKLGKRAK